MKDGTQSDISGSAPAKYVVIACASCVGVRTRKPLNEVDIMTSGHTDYTCNNCGDQLVVEAYETEVIL